MKKFVFVFTLVVSIFFVTNINASGSITIPDDNEAKYTVTREVNKVSPTVTNTYTYKIEQMTSNPAPVENLPTNFNIEFNNEGSGSESEKTISKDYILSFVGCKFNEVGDYRFLITETASTDSDNYPISEDSWEVDVSIRYKDNGTNQMEYTFVAPTKVGEEKSSDKRMKFTSAIVYSSISITGQVEGNMANPDEYFKIRVIINGDDGDIYKIEGQDENITYKGEVISTTNTYRVGEDNYIYLKHGQTVTIGSDEGNKQIPAGTTYKLIEEDAEKYKTSFNGIESDNKESGILTVVVNEGQNSNTFVNKYEKPTRTGFFLTIYPYIIILLLALAGIVYMTVTKKKED